MNILEAAAAIKPEIIRRPRARDRASETPASRSRATDDAAAGLSAWARCARSAARARSGDAPARDRDDRQGCFGGFACDDRRYLEPQCGLVPTDVAREIFSAPDVIAGGVFRADGPGRSTRATGVSHHRQVAMGVRFGPMPMAEQRRGRRRERRNSAAEERRARSRMLFFPAADAELIDSRHVAGLCGTGSAKWR